MYDHSVEYTFRRSRFYFRVRVDRIWNSYMKFFLRQPLYHTIYGYSTPTQ